MNKKTPPKSDPRRLVFQAVMAVFEKGVPLDDAIEHGFAKAGLDERDRAFVKNLAATLFRNLGGADHAIRRFLKKPLGAKAEWVKTWLRIGAVQILFLDVPAHAAVDTTVNAIARTKRPGAKAFKGLANAILRNIERHREGILKDLAEKPETNLPKWFRERWAKTFGPEALRNLADALTNPPPLDVAIKNPAEAKALADALKGAEIYPGVIRLKAHGLIPNLPGFKDGRWWAQDLAASLPPRLLGEVNGKTVLDLCAAPGGKTLFLASRGAKVTAVDSSEPRLKRLRENLQRTKLAAEVVCADILEFEPGKTFDAILLDAPCSATGTLRRHPDVPWQRNKAVIERLAGLQQKMLAKAIILLKPGGILVYCVCSLEPEEGPAVIKDFLENNPGLKRAAVTAEDVEGHRDWITPDGDLRTLPFHLKDQGGLDGFFAARLIKV